MTPKSFVEPEAAADADLFRLLNEFHPVNAEARAMHRRWVDESARVRALPDCPTFAHPAQDREAYDTHEAFLKSHGVDALCDATNTLRERAGKLARKVFTVPANTIDGAISKLCLVRLAFGNGNDTGDVDLEVYQEGWFNDVLRDFQRIAPNAMIPPDAFSDDLRVCDPDPADGAAVGDAS